MKISKACNIYSRKFTRNRSLILHSRYYTQVVRKKIFLDIKAHVSIMGNSRD